MTEIKGVLFRALHEAFRDHHIDFDESGLCATVNGHELSISEEEVRNNNSPSQQMDLISVHIAALRSRMAS